MRITYKKSVVKKLDGETCYRWDENTHLKLLPQSQLPRRAYAVYSDSVSPTIIAS